MGIASYVMKQLQSIKDVLRMLEINKGLPIVADDLTKNKLKGTGLEIIWN